MAEKPTICIETTISIAAPAPWVGRTLRVSRSVLAGTAATSARWPTGLESVGPGVDRAGTTAPGAQHAAMQGLTFFR